MLSADQAPTESWRKRNPALARFVRNKLAVLAAFGVVLIFVVAIFGPAMYHVDPAYIDEDLIGIPEPPSKAHAAGTDAQGRDMLARLLAGSRISLAVGIVSCVINLVIGVGIGVAAGWALASESRMGKATDTALMRSVDILYSIPLLLVVILLQIFVSPLVRDTVGPVLDKIFGVDSGESASAWQTLRMLLSPELISIYIALGVTNWLTMARLSRGEVLNQAKMEYVLAARALGIRPIRILFRHILPNCMGPLAVAATLAIPEAIFIESFLGFVGIGVSAPQASWGTLASDGVGRLNTAPTLLIFPALAISVTMLAFNLFGDGLRDALDSGGRG